VRVERVACAPAGAAIGAVVGLAAYGVYRIFWNPTLTSMTRNEYLVHESLAFVEKFYGKSPTRAATFEVQEVPGARHADWDSVKNHVTIRIPPNMKDIDREGQLAHEAFHVFSPATLDEATYMDEGLATLLAIEHRHYFPCADDIKYNEALSLVRRLIETCGDSVRNLLNERKRIAFVSEADIAAVCNQFSPSDAQRLVRKFYR
jgi:hypothetical protein